MAFNLCEEVLEGEGKIAHLQDLLDVQRKSSQQLCLSFNEAHREMVTALKVARKEKMKRQAMKRELDKLKGEFAKLKGMVRLTVASLNLQNHGTPTEDIQDIFNPQIVEESSDEEGGSSGERCSYPCSWSVVGDPPFIARNPTKSRSFASSVPIRAHRYCFVYSAIRAFSSTTALACQGFDCGGRSDSGGV